MAEQKTKFESEIETHYEALARAATVLCWSSADVEDVMQETLLKAFQAYPTFQGRSSFITWCYAILARVAKTRNATLGKSFPPDYGQSQHPPSHTVDLKVIANEEHRCVIDAIRSLPERQKEVMTLHFLENVTYAEIAVAMNLSVGTVKATVFQGKTSLRLLLAKKGIYRKAIHDMP